MSVSQEQLSYRSLILLTLPAMLAVMLEPMAEMIDTAVLGHESTLWVAGLAATNACLGSFAWIFNFLSYGVTAQIAQSYGAGRTADVGAHIRAALGLALVIGLTVGAVLFVAQDWFLVELMGTEGELYHTALSYYSIRVLGYPLTILSIALIGVLRGLQAIKFSGVVVLVMTFVNGVGTYLSVFHWGWGIEGAATATVLSFLVGDLLALSWLFCHSVSSGLTGRWRIAWEDIASLGSDGLNLAGRTGLLTIAFFLLTAAAIRLGVDVAAAHQVGLQLWLLASFVIDGLGITATTLCGQLVGAGEQNLHRLLSRRLLRLGLALGGLFSVLYFTLQPWLIGIYTDQADIILLVGSIWLVIALSQPINAVAYVLDGVLFGDRAFAFLRKHMFEGFTLVFLPLLYVGYVHCQCLLGLWVALIGLNSYRAASNWYQVAYKQNIHL